MANKFREKPVEAEPVQRQQQRRPAPEVQATPEAMPTPEPSTPEKSKEKVKLGKTERTLSRVLAGDMLADKFVIRQIPLVLLCLVCFLMVVANRYNVETVIRDRIDTQERISRLREKRTEIQVKYQQGVSISRIAEVLKDNGSDVSIIAGPPYEIDR